MEHHQDSYPGPRGAQLFRQWWLPEREPGALIVLVHGMAEHSGRYNTSVKDLVAQGYGVYALDHLGHGRSDGGRCCVKSFADFTQPLHQLILKLKQQYKNVPVFLLGHSMGGLICAIYLLDHQDEVKGAILSAPAVLSYQRPNFITVIKLMFYLIFSPNTGMLQLDASGVSRDPEVVTAYLNDPLVYTGQVPACLLLAMTKAMKRLLQQAGLIQLPLLILQGDQDRLVNPEGAQLLYQRVGSQDKQLERYPDSYHEILNEPEYPQIINLIQGWLSKRLNNT